MKKIYSKMFVCMLITLLALSTISMCIPVKASSGISPFTYDEYNFSFKGRSTISRGCTGMWLDVRVKATASNNNNETITLDMYIANRNVTKSVTFLSDGQYHTYKGIYLGLSGGSDVGFTFTGANPAITINMYLEIGS